MPRGSGALQVSVLRQREFLLLAAARFLWVLGQQVFNISMSLLVFDETRSALALGLIGLVSFLPGLCLTLVSGPVADRIDRRLISAVCILIAALASIGVLFIPSGASIAGPFVAVGLIGGVRAFAAPALTALLPNVVGVEQIAPALAWSNSLSQIANISGPMVGAFLYAASSRLSFLASAALFGLAVAFVFALSPRPPTPGRKMDFETLIAGYRYIWSRPVVLGAISLDLVAVILGGAVALLPIYAIDIFHAGPEAVGVLRAANALGALAAALFMGLRPIRRSAGRLMFICVIIFGAATIGFGVSTHLPPAVLFLFVLGAADQVSVVIRGVLIQLQTPDEMRGRVSAAFSVIVDASNQMGQFESGVAARLIGTVGSVVLGGAGSIFAALIWIRWFPELWRFDRLK